MSKLDPARLAKDLIQCQSVTPADDGVVDVLIKVLEEIGFNCRKITFGDVTNLYARIGDKSPNFCFSGHTDVVPPGDLSLWQSNPFKPEARDGKLYGRGASDMKAAIASFVTAASKFVEDNKDFEGSISLLITGDEEVSSENGMIKMLDYLKNQGEVLDACIVGEPTNPRELGEMVKIGRRGSLCLKLEVEGIQGHVAYPHLADNPLTRLAKILAKLKENPLDQGNEFFQASNLEITSIDVGNLANNVIPAKGTATFNIRYNTLQTKDGLMQQVTDICQNFADNYKLEVTSNSNPFFSGHSRLSEITGNAIKKITGKHPEFSTTGGTSDARFIKDYCPVIEFGLSNETAHKIDENVAISDIYGLSNIYLEILQNFFQK